MNDFSTTRETDGIAAACQQGNIFFVGNPENLSCPDLRGHVGGSSTPNLPMNSVETLLNDLSGTLQPVRLDVKGRPYTLLRSSEDFGQCLRPDQLQVRIGLASPPPPAPPPPFQPDPEAMARARGEGVPHVPIGQVSSARLPGQMGSIPRGHEMNALDVLSELRQHEYAANREAANEHAITAIEVDPEFGAPPGGDGTKNVEELEGGDTRWLSETVQSYVKRIGGVAIKVGVILSVQEHRAFLREMGFTKARFYRMANGTRMVAFHGNNRLRSIITGTSYGMGGLTGKNVTLLNTAFQAPAGNAASAVKNLGKKAGVIGLVFVAGIDIAAHYSQPEHERELSDLLVDLILDLSMAVVSAVAGAIVAGAAIAASTVAAPVVLFVAAGIGVSVAVGWAIGKAVSYTGLRESMKNALRNTNGERDEIYRGMMTAP